MPDWQADHQALAEATLEKARAMGPLRRDQTPFEIEPPPFDPKSEALLRQMVSLSPAWDPRGAREPASPQLMLIAAPEGDAHALLELMRLLTAHDVQHMIVLDDLAARWTRDREQDHLVRFAITANMPPLRVTSTPARTNGRCWVSQLEFQRGALMTPAHSPAASRADPQWLPSHSVERLQLPAYSTGLLAPDALQCALDWMRVHALRPDQRIAILAREEAAPPRHRRHDENPLLAMGGQLATALALEGLHSRPQDQGPIPRTRRDTFLRDAVAQLHQHNPALVGGVPHLCAALAVHDKSRPSMAGAARTNPAPRGAT